MEHFVTLFNSLFLPQGLALHTSLTRQMAGRFTLWIVCVDRLTHDILTSLDLAGVRLIRLGDVETPELLAVKSGRSIGEYCWTITSFTPNWVFDSDSSVQRVTYLDADVWFQKEPDLALRDFLASGKAVQITPHAFAAEEDTSDRAGIYCVQFMTFLRDSSAQVLDWWQDRCVEWCFDRFEDGKFGDQKYLDDWPSRFPALVHVLRDEQMMQGPWNASRFPFSSAVMYHFHGLKILKGGRVHLGPYPLPRPTLTFLYGPYLVDLRGAVERLEAAGVNIQPQAARPSAYRAARMRAAFLVRHLWVAFGPLTRRF